MGQTVQLTIPKACHEDWHTMTADQKGRFCKSCCKSVVDFTNMSDRAILHHIANAGGSRVCGRLHTDQLHRSMSDSASTTIRGRVVDHEGVALPGASIVIEGSSRGTTTDQDGNFSFNWPKDKNVVLVVSSVGFKPLRKKIKAKNRQGSMLLQLKMSQAVMGELVFCIR